MLGLRLSWVDASTASLADEINCNALVLFAKYFHKLHAHLSPLLVNVSEPKFASMVPQQNNI